MPTFYINVLIQLHCPRHVSNIQVFIRRKTCTCSFMVFLSCWNCNKRLYGLSKDKILSTSYRPFATTVSQSPGITKRKYYLHEHNHTASGSDVCMQARHIAQTDRQTDRQTNRQTDIGLWPGPYQSHDNHNFNNAVILYFIIWYVILNTLPFDTAFLMRFIAHRQYIHTGCTKINYRIVPVTNLNKYLQYGTSGTE
jgi:hypothetical protein